MSEMLKECRDEWNNGEVKFVSYLLDLLEDLESLATERQSNGQTIQPHEILDKLK